MHYLVDAAPDGWTGGSVGFVTPELLKGAMPPTAAGDDVLVLVCGPPGMMKAVSGDKDLDKSQGELSGALKALGYASQQVFYF